MNFPSKILLAAAALLVAQTSRAQVVTVNQSFTGTTAPGWDFGGNGAYTPTLTNTSSGLTLTTSAGNEATYAYDPTSFTSANATIAVQFTYTASDGSNPAADGITFFLANAATVSAQGFTAGAYGGSLGYAQKTVAGGGGADINGMVGGYLGLGLDQFGNYSNPTEGRIGGPGFLPNEIAVRGPGSGLTGYNYLGGTTSGSIPNFTAGVGTGSAPVVTNFELTISATNQVVVYMEEGGVYTPIFTADLSGYIRPANLVLGFTGSTGGDNSTQQIANVLLTSVTANLWTNTGADSKWGTTNNWFGNPTNAPGSAASANNPSDVLLNNAYVSTAQTISLNGGTQTLRQLMIDAPFSYTVGSSAGDGTIAFNNEGIVGPSGIYVTQTTGTATQTVNSNLVADNAINIQNNTTSALNLNGSFDTKGNAITFSGSGNTYLSGIVSNSTGTGNLIFSGTGTNTLSGANTYNGATTISAGTVNANSSTALGTSTVALSGATLGSTNSSSITNTVNLGGSSTFSGITTGGTLNSSGSNTLTMVNATQSGAVNLSTGATANTLTVEVDSGTSAINGVIANGGTSTGDNLTKTGNGTLTLGGTDTYTGTTTINGGTVQLGKSSVLAATSNLSIGATGTFNLAGFSQQVGTLTAAGGATLSFGTLNTGNSFLFGTYSPPASGVLTINDWGASDSLATTVKNQTVSTVYISGYGEAMEQTTKSTVLGDASSYLLVPVTETTNEWKGGTLTGGLSLWQTNANWNANAVPTTAQVALFNTLGLSNLTATVSTNTSVGGIEFGTGATSGYTIAGTKSITLSNATYAVPSIQQFSTANQTISTTGGIILDANTVTNETSTGNLTISAPISGAFNLVNDGTSTGKLILTGANSYHSLDNNSGVVQIGSTTAMGTQAATISSGAGLEITGGISPTNAISIAGTGVSGAGVLHNVGGTNTLSGTITEAANSTIAADSGTTLNLTGSLTGTNTNTTFVGPGTTTVSAVTTGTGAVALSSGTLTFNGTNTYTGTTTDNGGTLNLSGSAGTTGGAGGTVNGDLTINSGTVAQTTSNQLNSASTLTLNGGTYNLTSTQSLGTTFSGVSGSTLTVGTGGNLTLTGSGNSVFGGTLSGAGTISQTGTGELSLSGTGAGFTGNLALSNGIANVSGNNNVLGTGTVAVSGTGNFEIQGGLTLGNAFTLSTNGASSGNGAIESVSGANTISGGVTLSAGSTVQSDSGTLTLSGTVATGANTLTVTGSGNTSITGQITGTTGSSLVMAGSGTLTVGPATSNTVAAVTVSSGTLQLNTANAFSATSPFTVSSGAILNLNSTSQAINSLSDAGALNFGTSGTLNLTGGTSSLSGTMSGTGTLIIGAGETLTLGANFSDAGLNIELNGGSLDLNGTTDTFGNLLVNASGSVLDFGSGTNSILSVNDVTFTGASTLAVNNWSNAADYFYSGSDPGTTRGSAPLNQITFDSPTWTGASTAWMTYTDGPDNNHQITPVPEPATYGALFMGLCVAAFFVYRRRVAV